MMTEGESPPSRLRPTVSVVVPFFGDAQAAMAVVDALETLSLRPGDELILADNTPDGVAARLNRGEVRVVTASGERSSYHARNVGAEHARGEWLLFTDADCVPQADLLDAFFRRPVDSSTALVAGAIEPVAGEETLLAEWASSREILSQRVAAAAELPAAATACLLVRRSAWVAVGGFQEGVRSGADLEFCWRLADRGYRLEFRPEASVEHRHRESLRAIARQMARYSAGNAWQQRRRPGSAPRDRPLADLARALAGTLWFALTLRGRRAALKLVDGVAVTAQLVGRGLSNSVVEGPGREARRGPSNRSVVIATDRFPELSETFVGNEILALAELGWSVRVEAVERPDRPAVGGTRGIQVHYIEDEGVLARFWALAWLLVRHPLRSAADRFGAARWADERLPLRAIAPQARRLASGREGHVHVHFAALAASNALRAGRLVGVPVSFIGHGHELFVTPRVLPQKLAAAAFAAGPCEYTTRYMRELAPNGAEGRVTTIVMGVDGERFCRRRPYPGGRTVVAVGRLVEKKGFGFLIDAVAELEATQPIERLRIAGEGPLRPALQERIAAAGLSDRVELLGALDGAHVRTLLEEADVVAVPCVIASNGDRDAMPVVAKEALAMEVPVVASDEVGLPEVVGEGWGRLVPPADPVALAGAVSEVLALPATERAAMGAAGRAFVLERFSLGAEAERLSGLITELAHRGGALGARPSASGT